MKRREFVALTAAALAWSLAARAERKAIPVIGYIGSTTRDTSAAQLAGFRKGLSEAGFIEGQGVAIEFRWAEGQYSRLAAMASEFAGRHVSAIFASGLPAALAAKAATSTIPIVFVMGADPVEMRVVNSLNRPGGNVTGVSQLYGELGGKRLELLLSVVPAASVIALISNPKNPNADAHLKDLREAARAIGKRVEVFRASSEGEIDAAFANLVRQHASALVVADDPFFTVRRDQFVALANRYAVPAIFYTREFVATGGLMSYGSSAADNYRLAAGYVGRILNGAKPTDLPVLQPVKFELVINKKTAKSLGLALPPLLLAQADEVVE